MFSLRHNVIKTGLRQINVSYSRISLADVCQTLALSSVEETENIVAKAIYDGVCRHLLSARIETACVFSGLFVGFVWLRLGWSLVCVLWVLGGDVMLISHHLIVDVPTFLVPGH